MAYNNFKPTVWSAGIIKENERLCVFAEDCNRKYEGDIKNKGESVRILGVGKPTIRTLPIQSSSGDINGPEEIEDTSVLMAINQIRYFNYMIGDIDKAQSQDGILDALSLETSEGLANEIDKYIASFAVDSTVSSLYSTVPVVVNGTASSGEKNVLYVLDEAIEKLYENDVNPKSKIVVTVSPRFYTIFRREYASKDTDNSELLKNGRVGSYGNVTVKMSNNVLTSESGAVDNIMIRTSRAVAYANPLVHTEAYRPEKKFADAVKGFVLYDAKVVRPSEIININVKYS